MYKHASKVIKPFVYVHSSKTNLRETFRRIRAQLARDVKEQANVKPIRKAVKA